MQAPEVNASQMAQMLFNMNEVVDKKDRYACQSIFERYDNKNDKDERKRQYNTTDGLKISQILMNSKEATKEDIGGYFKKMDTITTSEAKKSSRLSWRRILCSQLGVIILPAY